MNVENRPMIKVYVRAPLELPVGSPGSISSEALLLRIPGNGSLSIPSQIITCHTVPRDEVPDWLQNQRRQGHKVMTRQQLNDHFANQLQKGQ